jgi:hypothetical protein
MTERIQAVRPSVVVTANDVYIAAYHTTAGYSVTQGFFADTALTNALSNVPLAALSNSEQANGLYTYGTAGQFPGSSHLASNYWVFPLYCQVASCLQASSPGATATAQAMGTATAQTATALPPTATPPTPPPTATPNVQATQTAQAQATQTATASPTPLPPTATPPTPPPTATPNVQATQTAQAQATGTAAAQATGTATAVPTNTLTVIVTNTPFLRPTPCASTKFDSGFLGHGGNMAFSSSGTSLMTIGGITDGIGSDLVSSYTFSFNGCPVQELSVTVRMWQAFDTAPGGDGANPCKKEASTTGANIGEVNAYINEYSSGIIFISQHRYIISPGVEGAFYTAQSSFPGYGPDGRNPTNIYLENATEAAFNGAIHQLVAGRVITRILSNTC